MSATALHPKSALPAMEDQTPPRVEKWKTSPGGPLERHVQTSSGENAQTSSGEHAGDAGSDLSDPNDDETNTETGVDLECQRGKVEDNANSGKGGVDDGHPIRCHPLHDTANDVPILPI